VVSWDRSPVVLAGLQHQRKDIISLLEAWIAANIGEQTLDDLVVAPSMRRQFPPGAMGRCRGERWAAARPFSTSAAPSAATFAQFVQRVTLGPETSCSRQQVMKTCSGML